MGNAHSEEQAPSAPPRPKHLLWGCETAEEHYAAIEEACHVAAPCHGEEGLARLGFEYRIFHAQPCDCGAHSDLDVESWSIDDEDDIDTDDQSEEFMIPLGQPINQHFQKESGSLFELESPSSGENILSKPPIRKSQSSVSLFSLSTHHSMGSASITSTEQRPPLQIYGHSHEVDHETCALRLYHTVSDTLVTERNHQTYIAHGKMYDEVARLCMEFAQDLILSDGDLEWTTLSSEPQFGAMVSRDLSRKKTLLIVTGKGKVGAGIFSRRLLMTLGVEPATALPFVREAITRDMNVVVLDPNCHGPQMATQVVETSLDQLFSQRSDDIYLLAHSMAGAQFARFLLNKAKGSSLGENLALQDVNVSTTETSTVESCTEQFKAVAFTDSNHNINWVKKYKSICDLFVGQRSLYIKSHKVHEDAKALGEAHHDCQYWRHRFGTIRTLWAGTKEHALTNYTARFHIWRHFDSFLDENEE